MKKTILYILFFCSSLFTLKAQGLWTQRASLPAAGRWGTISFSIGNYGYVGLGEGTDGSGFYKDFWQFNPSTNTWAQKANFPGLARREPACFVIGHKAYVIAGEDTNYHVLNECWEYDANTNAWTQKNNFPGAARGGAVGFAIGNKGFIATGTNGTVFYNDVWEYDTTSDTWTQKNNFAGAPRYYASGFAVGNRGYICFGAIYAVDAGIFINDMWQYDTTSDVWTQKTTYPPLTSIQCTSGFVIDSNIYVGTGQESGTTDHNWFWKYNTITDTWTQQSNFPGTARDACSAFAVGDTGYLGLGYDVNTIYYNDWYKFYPDTLTGVDEVSNVPNNFRVFPNPFSKSATISLNENAKSPVFVLYDITGKKEDMSITPLSFNSYTIHRNNLAEGVYILCITINNNVTYKKLIITN